jgi:hypothetical protein
MEKLFDLFKKTLIAHINTKTTNPLFHEKSQEFYELLFDCFHQISEKEQDVSDEATEHTKPIEETYSALEKAKEIIEEMINDEPTIGMDNLLRGLYDKLEFACGNARGFLKEEDEDESEYKKPKESPKKSISLKL